MRVNQLREVLVPMLAVVCAATPTVAAADRPGDGIKPGITILPVPFVPGPTKNVTFDYNVPVPAELPSEDFVGPPAPPRNRPTVVVVELPEWYQPGQPPSLVHEVIDIKGNLVDVLVPHTPWVDGIIRSLWA